MMIPSLSSRPFLNTRPVWAVTALAAGLGIVLLAVNIGLYISSNRRLEEQLVRRAELTGRVRALSAELRKDTAALEKVPWKKLKLRAERLNGILHEYAFSWQRLFRDLGAVLPREVRLYRISPDVSDKGVVLTIAGTARNREALLQLLQNMIDDPRFEDPLPRSETTPEGAAGTGYEFRMKVNYLPEEGRTL